MKIFQQGNNPGKCIFKKEHLPHGGRIEIEEMRSRVVVTQVGDDEYPPTRQLLITGIHCAEINYHCCFLLRIS